MWPTRSAIARRNSATLLLLPCITHAEAGTPAASATCSSPSVATSSRIPSSYASRAIARHRNPFVA